VRANSAAALLTSGQLQGSYEYAYAYAYGSCKHVCVLGSESLSGKCQQCHARIGQVQGQNVVEVDIMWLVTKAGPRLVAQSPLTDACKEAHGLMAAVGTYWAESTRLVDSGCSKSCSALCANGTAGRDMRSPPSAKDMLAYLCVITVHPAG
jgi:hypothetical protein